MRLSSNMIALLVAVSSIATAQTALEAGFAVKDITPPVGYRMSGYFHERVATGTHDPLQAKAIVLRQGDTSVAMALCDLVAIGGEVAEAARTQTAERTGIPYEHIVVSATHSHTGPLYTGVFRDLFKRQAVEAGREKEEDDLAYVDTLTGQIVEAISEAQAALAPVNLKHGAAQEDRVSFNRRFYMTDGSVRFNPGKMNPRIVRPAGPIDPEVGLIEFASPDGGPRALLTVFALHLDTVGGTEFSADYPHYLGNRVREALGDEVLPIFGIGPCGDINHVDVSHKNPQKGHDEAARIGHALAQSVVDAVPALEPLNEPSLAVARTVLDAPKPEYAAAEVAWSDDIIQRLEDRDVPFLDKVRARAVLDLERRPGDAIPLEVQAVRLGDDLAIVFLPGEVFAELGMALKYASPFETTVVIELANANVGYIPTAKAFREGSYETVNSRIRPGAGEDLIDTARRLLYSLKQNSD